MPPEHDEVMENYNVSGVVLSAPQIDHIDLSSSQGDNYGQRNKTQGNFGNELGGKEFIISERNISERLVSVRHERVVG